MLVDTNKEIIMIFNNWSKYPSFVPKNYKVDWFLEFRIVNVIYDAQN